MREAHFRHHAGFEQRGPRMDVRPHHLHHRRGPESRNSVYGNEDFVEVPREMLANLINGRRNNRRDDYREDNNYRGYDDYRGHDRGHGGSGWETALGILGAVTILPKALPWLEKGLKGSLLDRATGGLLSGLLGGINDFFGFGKPEHTRGQQGPQGQAPGTVNDGSSPILDWMKAGLKSSVEHTDSTNMNISPEYKALMAQNKPAQANAAYKQGATNFATELINNYFGGENGTVDKETFIDKYVEHAQEQYSAMQAQINQMHGQMNQQMVEDFNQKFASMGMQPMTTNGSNPPQLPPFDADAVKAKASNIYEALKDNNDPDKDITAASLAPAVKVTDGLTAYESGDQSGKETGSISYNALNDVMGAIGDKDSGILQGLKEASDFFKGINI